MSKREDAAGLACQIAFEYDDWGDEHVYEMLKTYERGKAPCGYDRLMALTCKAAALREDGLTFDEAEKKLLRP